MLNEGLLNQSKHARYWVFVVFFLITVIRAHNLAISYWSSLAQGVLGFIPDQGFYGISTIVGYLTPNHLYTYISKIYDLVRLGLMWSYASHGAQCGVTINHSTCCGYCVRDYHISFRVFAFKSFRAHAVFERSTKVGGVLNSAGSSSNGQVIWVARLSSNSKYRGNPLFNKQQKIVFIKTRLWDNK